VDKHIHSQKVDITATVETLATLFFWSLAPIFITCLTKCIDSWTQNFLRYLVSGILLFPFLVISIRKKKFDKSLWRKAIFPAAANITMQSIYAEAFYYINPAFMTLLMKSSIVCTALFSLVFFVDERPLVKSRRFWLGMILSIAGVTGVMYYHADFTAARTMTGIILSLASGLFWAIYTIAARIYFKKSDSIQAFSVTSIYTTIGLGGLTFLFGNFAGSLNMNAWQWSYVVVSSIIGIALSHVLYYAAMRRIGATIPALIILAQPFLVLAFSYFLFGESMNIMQFVSGVILLAGSAIAIWAQEHIIKA
jgi:drug/metabolite transporter (DMT)-like permease